MRDELPNYLGQFGSRLPSAWAQATKGEKSLSKQELGSEEKPECSELANNHPNSSSAQL